MTICSSNVRSRVSVSLSGVVGNKQSILVPRSCVVQTPDLLADAMVNALGKRDADTWLEPCIGNGALLSALSKFGVKRNKITGLDVDAHPQPNDRFGKVFRGRDFLGWSCSTRLRFDKIIANPPYVALERLESAIRRAAIEVSLSDKIRITANANAWYAFLCAAIRLLKNDGSLCFLLPAAWDFANYALPLRSSIREYFKNVEIYRTATPIFRAEKVQDGAIVLLARGRQVLKDNSTRKEFRPIYRYEVSSIDELILALPSRPESKKRGEPPRVAAPAVRGTQQHQLLGDILNIRLGIVTGDSSYFLLTEKRRRELRLPLAAVVPVLSRARHLTSPNMTAAQWNRLRNIEERIWLFNPKPSVSANQFVQSYLRFGRNGGCKTENHKVTIRNPWFRFSALTEGDGFMSGMSTLMPWLSFRSMPRLFATNTLYVVNFTDPLLKQPQRIAVAMSLLTSDVRAQMRERGRAYAAGLMKYEPSDLLGLHVPKVGEVVAGWEIYRRALRALAEGDEVSCKKIADSCLL
jgi:adenine-specific DNA-methyltransferase